jgi:signal peptidase I
MEQESVISQPQPAKKSSFLRELIIFCLIAFGIVLPFRMFIAEPYIVDGTSMYPTFKTGNYLIVDKLSYKLHEPKRFDVIVMIFPNDTSKDFIKRVIGLPGDTVKIVDGKVTIINAEYPKGMELNEPYVKYPLEESMTQTLKAGEYFVMGDNRYASYDSRRWGVLPRKDIVGTPLIQLWPLSHIQIRPGHI